MNAFGVGFLGSGPVTQAIHVPTIRRFPQLRIARFMDVDAQLAGQLAAQHRADFTNDEDELVNDPSVDIVVVCSPNEHHARQVIKACSAGKRVVLAEKPLALSPSQGREIQAAAQASGTHIVVGAMHAFDDAYLQARALFESLKQPVRFVEVRCLLPSNDEFIALATQLIASPERRPVTGSAPTLGNSVVNGILGLAMHDIPLVRDFLPGLVVLQTAQYVSPWGYALHGAAGGVAFKIVALMPGEWEPDWTLEVVGDDASLHVQFKPSYVLAGSAVATVRSGAQSRRLEYSRSAYESEWQHVIDLASGLGEPLYPLERILRDLDFASVLADEACNIVDGSRP